MENIFPTHLIDLLIVGVTASIITMVFIQKAKHLKFVTKNWQVGILNTFVSFAFGIPFAIWFYNLGLIDSIWVGVFSFIGAPAIYDALKNQTILTYKPTSLDDTITLSKENEIKREGI